MVGAERGNGDEEKGERKMPISHDSISFLALLDNLSKLLNLWRDGV